jgi:hypothetical protein
MMTTLTADQLSSSYPEFHQSQWRLVEGDKDSKDHRAQIRVLFQGHTLMGGFDYFPSLPFPADRLVHSTRINAWFQLVREASELKHPRLPCSMPGSWQQLLA